MQRPRAHGRDAARAALGGRAPRDRRLRGRLHVARAPARSSRSTRSRSTSRSCAEPPRDADDASVVTAVIAVAHSLGLRVIAQGVESEAQVALLRSLGCDEVQGFLWSPPVPPDAVRAAAGVRACFPPPLAARREPAGAPRPPRESRPSADRPRSGLRGRPLVEPGRAVGVELLLPDRHLRLEGVDREAAGARTPRRDAARRPPRPRSPRRSRASRAGARAAPRSPESARASRAAICCISGSAISS